MTMHGLYQNKIQMPRSWQDAVRAADSEDDVLDLVRDFVAQFSPYEIAEVPEPCRPGKFHNAGDVTEYAFDLVRHRCDENEGAAPIHRLSAFFADANQRLSQILRAPPPAPGVVQRHSTTS